MKPICHFCQNPLEPPSARFPGIERAIATVQNYGELLFAHLHLLEN